MCLRSEGGGGGGGLPSFVVCLDKELLCLMGPRRSSVAIVVALQTGLYGFGSRHGHSIFVFTETSRPAMGHLRTPIQELLLILSQNVNLMGPEVIIST